MLVKVQPQSCFALPMRLLFAVLVMRRSICATNLLADMYGLVLQIPAKFLDVIFVKMHQFPGDKPGNLEDPAAQLMDRGESRRGQTQQPRMTSGEKQQNHKVSPVPISETDADGHAKRDNKMIDLNIQPYRMHGQASNNQFGNTFKSQVNAKVLCSYYILQMDPSDKMHSLLAANYGHDRQNFISSTPCI